jgi:hypothetical protein
MISAVPSRPKVFLCRMKKTGLDIVSHLDFTKFDRLSIISSVNWKHAFLKSSCIWIRVFFLTLWDIRDLFIQSLRLLISYLNLPHTNYVPVVKLSCIYLWPYLVPKRVTFSNKWLQITRMYIDKIQQDATVCRYLFTVNILYMFRVSIAPIIRST